MAVWSRAAKIKILADLNLAVWYSIVIRIYAYTCNTEILADFNLAVVARTAKPPNLSHRQIFRLYGIPYSWKFLFVQVFV